MSPQVRKRIEQGFGWIKTIGGLSKLPMVSLAEMRGWVTWTFAAYSLIRLGDIGEWGRHRSESRQETSVRRSRNGLR